jgi:maleate cis-trans isomerase
MTPMTLEYAPGGLIGVLTPQANTTVEPEIAVLLPPGLALLNARLTSPKKTIEERLVDYLENVETAATQFANAPLKAVAFACTGASYLAGKYREAALIARLEDRLRMPVLTAARAVVDSLRVLAATRIGLVSCYPESLTQASIVYWQSHGLHVAEVARAFNSSDNFHPIYSLNGRAAAGALATLAGRDLDAVVMLGTGMPTLAPIAASIGWHGPPVTSCNLSLVWATVEAAAGRAPSRDTFAPWLKGEGWVERLRLRHPSAMLEPLA